MPSACEYAIGGNDTLLLKLARWDPELLHLMIGLLDGYRATDL